MKKVSDDYYKWLFRLFLLWRGYINTLHVNLRRDSLDNKYIAKYTGIQHILKSLYMWTFYVALQIKAWSWIEKALNTYLEDGSCQYFMWLFKLLFFNNRKRIQHTYRRSLSLVPLENFSEILPVMPASIWYRCFQKLPVNLTTGNQTYRLRILNFLEVLPVWPAWSSVRLFQKVQWNWQQ